MDLQELRFVVKTEELVDAAKKIEALGTAVNKLNKPMQEMATASDKVAKASEKKTKAEDEASKSASKLDKLLEKLNSRYADMANGSTSAEASVLHLARSLGATTENALKPYKTALENIRELSKSPFDSAIGSVRSISQEYESMTHRAELASKGIFLTTNQLKEYSKIASEIKGKLKAADLDPTKGEGLEKFNSELKTQQGIYLGIANQVNTLKAAEKDRNDALNSQMKEMARLQEASDNLFKYNQLRHTQDQQGYKRDMADMKAYYSQLEKTAGRVAQTKASKPQAGAMDDAVTSFYKNQAKAVDEVTKANEYLQKAMTKEVQLMNSSADVTSTMNNKLIAFETNLRRSGKTAGEQAIELDKFRKALEANQKVSGNRQVDYLSRALGPQITDITVGLATGQNPLTVMLQQGGQLRDQFALAGVAGKDMGNMLKTAAASMVTSVKDVTMAVGGLIVSMAASPITALWNRKKELDEIALKLSDNSISQLRANRLMEVANGRLIQSFVTMGSVGAAAFGITLLVAIKDVIEQEAALSKALALTGGSLGLNQDRALTLAKTYAGAKGNVGSFVEAITEVAKAGNVTSANLETVAKTIVEVSRVTGISAQDLAKNFSKISEKPTEGLIPFAKELGTINVEILKQVRNLELSGKQTEAVKLATEEYSKALRKASEEMKADMGIFETIFYGIGSAAKSMWDSILNIGRKGTLQEQMKEATAALAEAQQGKSWYSRFGRTNEEEVAYYLEIVQSIGKQINAEKSLGDEKAKNSADALKFEKQIKEAKEATLKVPEDITLKNLQKRYQDNTKIVDSETSKLIAANKASYASGLMSLEEYTNAELAIVTEQNQKKLSANNTYIQTLEIARDNQIQAIKDAYKAASANAKTSKDVEVINKQLADTIESVTENYDRMTDSVKANNEVIANKLIEDRIKAMEKMREETKKLIDSLTDAVMTSITDGGSAGAKKLRNIIKAELMKPITIVVQAVVGSIVQSATSSLLGSAAGSAGGSLAGSLLGNAASAAGLTSVFGSASAYGAAIGTTSVGAGSQAAMLAAQTGEFGAAGTAATSSAAAGAGSGAAYYGGYAAGALGGMALNRGISGEYQISKDVSTIQDIATIAATAMFGPIGGIIAGAASGVMNRAFGMGAVETTASGISGTFGANGADVKAYQKWQQSGGWFRSDKSGTNFSDIPTQLREVLDFALGASTGLTESYAKLIGANTDNIRNFTKQVDISLKGLDAAGQQAAIEKSITEYGEDLAATIVGKVSEITIGVFTKSLNPMIKVGETSSQALSRLATSLTTVNGVLETLNQTLFTASITGADAASKLADAFGGLETFTSATSAYYEAFYSEEERNAKTIERLQAAFAALGLALPDTLSGFRAIVDAQNLYTDEGRKTYATLLGLSSAFATVTNSAEEAAKATAESMRAAGQSISDWLKKLVGEIVTPQASLSATRSAYTSNLSLARANDPTALGSITGSADAYLAAAKATATTSAQYKLAVAQVVTQVSGLPAVKGYNDLVLEKLGLISTYTDDTANNTLDAYQTAVEQVDYLIKLNNNALYNVYTAIGGAYPYYTQMIEELKIIASKNTVVNVSGGGGGFNPLKPSSWFADGGVFGGQGVYSEPTMFMQPTGQLGVMGEAGPEAVMPLERLADGALGVRAVTSIASSGDSSMLWQAIDRLNANVDGLRAETRATVVNTSKTAKLLDRVVESDTIKVQTVTA